MPSYINLGTVFLKLAILLQICTDLLLRICDYAHNIPNGSDPHFFQPLLAQLRDVVFLYPCKNKGYFLKEGT